MSTCVDGWAMCSHFVLRRAGFPLDWLDALSLESAVPALRAVEDADAAIAASLVRWRSDVRAKLIDVVNERVEDDRALRALKRVNRIVKRGQRPSPDDVALLEKLVPEIEPWARAFVAQLEWRSLCRQRFSIAFDRDFAAVRRRLEDFAKHPRVREALFLLDDESLERAARLDPDEKRSSTVRKREQAVFGYLQRLCVKNETNGFGRIDTGAEEPALAFDPSFDGVPPKRAAFLSPWLITDIERKISADDRLADYLPVVSIPLKRKPGRLEWCDRGLCTARLADEWGISLNEARAKVGAAIERGEWERRIPIPPSEVRPLEALTNAVANLPVNDDSARDAVAEWLEVLGAFARDSQRFAATGEVKSKRAIQLSIEGRYAHLTGLSRTHEVIYEDAWFDRSFRLSEDASTRLLKALAPVLDIGAYFTRLVRARMTAEARAVMEAWFAEKREVPYERFIAAWHAQAEKPRAFSQDALARIADLDERVHEFEALWGEALDAFGQGVAPSSIRERCRAAVVDLPRVGPHILSPDVLPMKSGAAEWVLAEIHHGVTMDGWMMSFHPDAENVRSLIRDQLAVVAADANAVPANLVMGRHGRVAPQEYSGVSVEWSGYARDRDRIGTLAVRDLVVRDDGAELALYQRETDERLAFYPPGFDFDPRGYLPFEVFSLPIMRLPARVGSGKLPRSTYEGLVLARAEWRLASQNFAALVNAPDLATAMLRGLELRLAHGMPRFLFVRPAGEPKPLYLDWQSPLAVEMLITYARRGGALAFSEMLPGPDELVLRGTSGSYTSELRFMVTGKAS